MHQMIVGRFFHCPRRCRRGRSAQSLMKPAMASPKVAATLMWAM